MAQLVAAHGGRGLPKTLPARAEAPAKKTAKSNPLSESEYEEDLPEDDSQAVTNSDPLTQAVTTLTKIAGQLAGRNRQATTLEGVLDGSGSAASTESSSGAPRRNAAALRFLRKSLYDRPEELVRAIRAHMDEDFAHRPPVPGATDVSSIQDPELPEHDAPCMVPLWDCRRARSKALRGGRGPMSAGSGGSGPSESRPRELDVGQCIRLGERAALQQLPESCDADLGEQPFTKLLDGRIIELLMFQVKEIDEYLDRRRRLGRSGGTDPNHPGGPTPSNTTTPPTKTDEEKPPRRRPPKGGGKAPEPPSDTKQ